MGDVAQLEFGKLHLPKKAKTVIEIGSKDYGSTPSFRSHYPKSHYIGVDLEDGDGVDVVQDLEAGTGSLPLEYFDVGICCSVLEHVQRPWIFAENISKLIKQGGKLYIGVPWVHRYHCYPDDYWRMSPPAIKILFPDFEWQDPYLMTIPHTKFIKFKLREDNRMHKFFDGIKYLPYFHFNIVGKKKWTS